MQLYQLFKLEPWSEVKKCILEIFPSEAIHISKYKEVFFKLQNTEPAHCEFLLCIGIVDELEDEEGDDKSNYETNEFGDEDNSFEVYGKSKDDDEIYSLEFMTWAEWLGMEIETETQIKFQYAETIAYSLFEMTLIDFDESAIQKHFALITESIEAFEKLPEEEKIKKAVSFEDLANKIKLLADFNNSYSPN